MVSSNLSVLFLFSISIFKQALSHIEHIEKYIIGILVFAGILLILINRFKKQKETRYENAI